MKVNDKPDPVQFALEWLAIAEDDLKWAKISFKGKMYSRACFISQQVAEKSLKGFLYFSQKRAPKTHKLVDITQSCVELDPKFSLINKPISILAPLYLETRYPDFGDINRYNKDSLAKNAIEAAQKVLEFVKKRIEKAPKK